jgi:hypothetical protein
MKFCGISSVSISIVDFAFERFEILKWLFCYICCKITSSTSSAVSSSSSVLLSLSFVGSAVAAGLQFFFSRDFFDSSFTIVPSAGTTAMEQICHFNYGCNRQITFIIKIFDFLSISAWVIVGLVVP